MTTNSTITTIPTTTRWFFSFIFNSHLLSTCNITRILLVTWITTSRYISSGFVLGNFQVPFVYINVVISIYYTWELTVRTGWANIKGWTRTMVYQRFGISKIYPELLVCFSSKLTCILYTLLQWYSEIFEVVGELVVVLTFWVFITLAGLGCDAPFRHQAGGFSMSEALVDVMRTNGLVHSQVILLTWNLTFSNFLLQRNKKFQQKSSTCLHVAVPREIQWCPRDHMVMGDLQWGQMVVVMEL